MFRSVSATLNVMLLEESALNFWKLHRIFAKAAEARPGAAEFVYYDAPAAAGSLPDPAQAAARACLDLFARYKSMRGYHVLRRSGWDAHTSAVELAAERRLGLAHKNQIEAYGVERSTVVEGSAAVERFNTACRQAAAASVKDWERLNDRLGYWADGREAYVSYTNDYIESVWWALKTLWDRGLIYHAWRVGPYCPRCATPLSAHDAAQDVRPAPATAIVVRLPLADAPRTSLLVATEAAWTLPGNLGVAAHPDAEYVTVERALLEGGKERLILARAAVEAVFGDERVRIVDSFKGRKLKDRRYKPLFTFITPQRSAHSVLLDHTVKPEDGSGLVPLAQIAPGFAAESALLHAGLDQDLPALMPLAADGAFLPEVRPWSGVFAPDADAAICADLEGRGLLFKSEMVTRPQPHCPACAAPLLRVAHGAWYVRLSAQAERLERLGREVRWMPARPPTPAGADWAISRERFWGTPLPVWDCDACHHQVVIGSAAELGKLAGRELNLADLHRPFIDRIALPCPRCHAPMRRVSAVLDHRFDLGAAPAAQWHFPYENRERFRAQFPADLICTLDGDSSGWAAALHAVAAALFDSVAYKHALRLAAPAGKADIWRALETCGADALRWSVYASEEPDLAAESLGAALGDFSGRLWGVYAFFVAFANRAGWKPAALTALEDGPAGTQADLDRWLISELNLLARQVTEALDGYDLRLAARWLQAFVDDLALWYLPRARRRLMSAPTAGEIGADADAAFATLHTALLALSKLLAPATPFLAEALYQNLARSFDLGAPESVQLCDWPGYDPEAIDEALNDDMRLVMHLAALGHAARRAAGIRAVQPLAAAGFALDARRDAAFLERFAGLLADELNVKRVEMLAAPAEAQEGPPELLEGGGAADGAYRVRLETALTPELKREALAHEFVRRIQELRRAAEVEIAGEIVIDYQSTPGLEEALAVHREWALAETLAQALHSGEPPAGATCADAWFDGQWLKAGIRKAE